MKLLITGDRKWPDEPRIAGVMDLISAFSYATHTPITLIHGDANGADRMGANAAEERGIPTIAVPADWSKYGKGAGPVRNARMLDMLLYADELELLRYQHNPWEMPLSRVHKPDSKSVLCVAFHNNLTQSKGTKDMVTRALKAQVPVFLVEWSRYVEFGTTAGGRPAREGTLLALLQACASRQVVLPEAPGQAANQPATTTSKAPGSESLHTVREGEGSR